MVKIHRLFGEEVKLLVFLRNWLHLFHDSGVFGFHVVEHAVFIPKSLESPDDLAAAILELARGFEIFFSRPAQTWVLDDQLVSSTEVLDD